MNLDPIEIFEQQARSEQEAAKQEQDFQRLTKQIFTGTKGKQWLRLAMGRMNFMGSVFDEADGMNAIRAAHRDGMRAMISDILNSAAQAPTSEPD